MRLGQTRVSSIADKMRFCSHAQLLVTPVALPRRSKPSHTSTNMEPRARPGTYINHVVHPGQGSQVSSKNAGLEVHLWLS